MRRITKIGSITVALVIALPMFFALDWFGGAEAAQDAPLLYAAPGPDVSHVDHAEMALPSGAHVYAYATAPDSAADPGALVVRERADGGATLFSARAPNDAAPWSIVDVALSADGGLIVAGTLEGLVLVVGSRDTLYDTFRIFDAGSAVTDVAADPGGSFFTAVTYGGDMLLFQREAFFERAAASYRDRPAAPAAPTDDAEEMLDPVLAYQDPIDGDEEGYTVRPFSHVTFVGTPASDSDPRGLAVVAGTVYGALYAYDLAAVGSTSTSDAAPYRPTVHHVGDAPCREAKAPGGPVELPCNQAASARLIERTNAATGGALPPLVSAVAAALRDTLRLDHATGLTLAAAENPLVGLSGTLGSGNNGRQLVVATTRSGAVDAIGLTPGVGSEDWLTSLWAFTAGSRLQHSDVSRVAGPLAHRTAVLALVSDHGSVSIYKVRPGETTAPKRTFLYDAAHGAGSISLTSFALSKGYGRLGEAAAGIHFAYTTEADRVALVDTRVLLDPETPAMAWEGPLPLGSTGAIDITDSGSVLVGGAGVGLYASLVSLRIDAPGSIAKMAPFRAEAAVDAPDSTLVDWRWIVEPAETGMPAPRVVSTERVLEHIFRVEGPFRVTFEATDDHQLTTRAEHLVTVGGAKPVVVYSAPTTVPVGGTAVFDFTGTRDPDSATGGHGLSRIDFFPYGDGRMVPVDLTTMTVSVTYAEGAGVYVTRARAYDLDGRSGVAERTVRITGAGYAVSIEPVETGPMRLQDLAIAEDTGHLASFGGNNGAYGRIQFRGPDTTLLYSLGSAQTSNLPWHVGAGAITPDGTLFYGGQEDGALVRMPIGDPTDRVRLDVFDEAVAFVFVADDGDSLVAVSEAGHVASVDPMLGSVLSRASLGSAVRDAHADGSLVHLVIWTDDGRLVLLDGENAARGILDMHPAESGPTALGLTPNLDPQGRAWAFLGRADGRVETLKIQGSRFHSLGNATYHEGVAIHDIDVGALDEKSEYRLAAVSRGAKITCKPDTSSPCGRVFYVDSRGPRVDNRPVPAKSYELKERPLGVSMTHDGRNTLVVMGESRHSAWRFDTLWADGPVARLVDLPGRVLASGLAETGAGYLLVDTGQMLWAYAPPRATLQIGPHEDGTPRWGERVSSQNDVTFDATATRPGDGTIISYEWLIDGVTHQGPSVVTRFDRAGAQKAVLTVTSRVTSPTEALLVDRFEKAFAVWDPPPIGRLSASHFDAAQNAVVVDTGTKVRFDASASYDPLGQRIATYKFIFGDTQTAMGSNPVRDYAYTEDGVYWARVTAYDSDGFGGTSERIKVIVNNRAPAASFKMEQPGRNETTGTVTLGVPVTFDAALSNDPDGNVVGWEWVFSDGRTAATKTLSHTFGTIGGHTVQLRVRDNDGRWSDTLVANVLVDDGIRLRQTQDPPSGRQVSPTQAVNVFGFVHDFRNHPADGTPVSGAVVHIKVYFDGALGSEPASSPYHSTTKTTDAAGQITHQVPFNQAGVAYRPGSYRVTMTAVWSTSANGDTEWSETTQTVFTAQP